MMPGKTHDDGRAALDDAAARGLRAALRGPVLVPGDDGYEAARRVHNGMIDRRPAAIAQCVDGADVQAAVRMAREYRLLAAVRGGGHSGAGFGVCAGGLVIDLSRMRAVEVNPASRTVRVGGGCVWGDVDRATQPFGLAVPAGIVSSTGVAGLTLGGGHGYLTRKYGLTIDNLLAVDMVLADGSRATASADRNPDLFWAVRGGGGNFGVVTSFVFRAQPVSTVWGGPTLWPIEMAGEAMRWWRDFTAAASEDMYGFFKFLNVPPAPPFPERLHGSTMCGVVWCYSGPAEKAEEAFAPVRRFGPPVFEHLGPMPIAALNSAFDPLLPPGLQWYWKGDFVRELGEEAIGLHAHFGSALPSALSTMHMYPVDGAVHRVAADGTAFRYRDCRWSCVIAGIDPEPANKDRISAWAKDYWSALHPHSAGGAYVNFMMEEGQERVRATYGENYGRLAAVKRRYDPDNFFRANQNIAPAD